MMVKQLNRGKFNQFRYNEHQYPVILLYPLSTATILNTITKYKCTLDSTLPTVHSYDVILGQGTKSEIKKAPLRKTPIQY